MYMKLDDNIKNALHQGTVIPAHPLALHPDLTLNIENQRLLTRYYMASGAGGVAVGVHTTQFEIRRPEFNLLGNVLKLAAEEIEQARPDKPFIKIAGICGPTEQAVAEARLAVKYGYHLGLLSMGGLQGYTEPDLLQRVIAVAEIIPVFGFYLQPVVGGRYLSYDFWRAMAEIPNVHAIKVAAFNRYHTLDVVRAVCDSSRHADIALYTGNDDNIVADLLTPYRFTTGGKKVEKRFVGGLLGHWAVWTKKAVDLFREIQRSISGSQDNAKDLLSIGTEITDMNAALFDIKNSFKGCIAGIHEVLKKQGLMEGIWCLSPDEKLSGGQSRELDRIEQAYPHHTDNAFVKDFLARQHK